MRICVFTGTRAEYGLLKPLMDAIKSDDELELQLIVSGTHLAEKFGRTVDEIERDGFIVNEKINVLQDSDTALDVCHAIGMGVQKYAKALDALRPDLMIILGDRFEGLAMATAAMVMCVPIAHLYGGEGTYGLIDEPIRHSISKMSHLHFVATEEYQNRVIQLGETPERVFNVGAIGLDNIHHMDLLTKEELEKALNFKFGKRTLLVTFHPVTLESDTAEEQFNQLLATLEQLEDAHIIFTKANADMGGSIINKMIDDYVNCHAKKSIVFTSMGQKKYLSSMKYVNAVVGNSSSGIIEAPSFRVGTINIGDRQAGRLKASSVIDCLPKKEDLERAFKKIFSEEFQDLLKVINNPYGDGKTTPRIMGAIKNIKLEGILKKKFYDLTI